MIKVIVLALMIACLVESGFCAESNEVRGFKVLTQTSNSAVFEIKYYYSGDHGGKAELTAWPLPPGYWGSTIVTLVTGEHTVHLTATLGPKVPKEVSSESIELLYISGGGPPFYKQEFPLKKTWANTPKENKKP